MSTVTKNFIIRETNLIKKQLFSEFAGSSSRNWFYKTFYAVPDAVACWLHGTLQQNIGGVIWQALWICDVSNLHWYLNQHNADTSYWCNYVAAQWFSTSNIAIIYRAVIRYIMKSFILLVPEWGPIPTARRTPQLEGLQRKIRSPKGASLPRWTRVVEVRRDLISSHLFGHKKLLHLPLGRGQWTISFRWLQDICVIVQ